jgi:hypothetical protein
VASPLAFKNGLQGVMNTLTVKRLVIILLLALSASPTSASGSGFGDIFKIFKKTSGIKDSLSTAEVVDGLKEALEIGTQKAVLIVSRVDGYYKNPEIKIFLPASLQKVESLLRSTGFSDTVDQFELSMNRAAEDAAPHAKALFWDAIRQMNFTDARKILNGGKNEATLYFKDKTGLQLQNLFKPLVRKSMSTVGVTRSYQDLMAKMETIPFARTINYDLDQYVTEQAIDGLFLMLAKEEAAIRSEPSARVTDLLKKVFANQ